jgi:hypothetical protein
MFGWPLSELYGVRRCFPKVWEASFFECYQLSQEEYVTMLILDQCFRKIAKENKSGHSIYKTGLAHCNRCI